MIMAKTNRKKCPHPVVGMGEYEFLREDHYFISIILRTSVLFWAFTFNR